MMEGALDVMIEIVYYAVKIALFVDLVRMDMDLMQINTVNHALIRIVINAKNATVDI